MNNIPWLHWASIFMAGFVACFGLGTALLMSPHEMLRWVFAPGSSEEKISRALDPQPQFDEFRARLKDAQSELLQCVAKKAVDAKSREPLTSSEKQKCVSELEGLYDQTVYPDQATSFLGGRMYISVDHTFGINGCSFFVRTGSDTKDVSYRWGASLPVQTEVGSYSIIPKQRALAYIGAPGCTFDIIKDFEVALPSKGTNQDMGVRNTDK